MSDMLQFLSWLVSLVSLVFWVIVCLFGLGLLVVGLGMVL